MSFITTHILDTSIGKPAAGVKVTLSILKGDSWSQLAQGITNNDGRITNLLTSDHKAETGIYKLDFSVGPYFEAQSVRSFYPYIEIVFDVREIQHYHVPLLLNPFGYSTYRGS